MNKAISTVGVYVGKYLDWWEHVLPIGVPLLMGLVLGPLVAFSVVNEIWILAYVIPFLVPLAILFVRYPFAAVIIWMVILPFFPPSSETRYFYWIFHRALLPGTLGIVILSRAFRIKKYQAFRITWAEFAMLGYLATNIISILLTRSRPLDLIYELYDKTFVGFAAYWLVRSIVPDSEDLQRMVPFMLFLCLAESVIGAISWFAPEILPPMWTEGVQGGRTAGTLMEAAAYTSTLMWLMLFLFHYAVNYARGLKYLFFVFVFVLGFFCIFISYSRGSWAGAILAMFGLICIYPKQTLPLVFVVLSVGVMLSATVLADEYAYAYQRLTNEAGKRSAEARLVHSNAAIQMFLAKPILGWGYATYDFYDWRFMERVKNVAPNNWDIKIGTSHNTYLTMLAETGALGFLTYMFPLVWWLGRSIKALFLLPGHGFLSRRLLIIMWISVGFYILVGQIMDMRFFRFNLTTLWLNLGLIANMVMQAHSQPDQRLRFGWRSLSEL